MNYPKLRLYPTVEELKQQADTLNRLPDKEYEKLVAQGIPEILCKYLRKRDYSPREEK